ncbi:hypothetical protein [Corallococcus sp. RDP092CA]|uniref:hypothetical protein n=1 Tax=Corallococcus sp. RDP092CA TaxID=3109369 RepID=UPI0035AF3A0D
MFTTLMKFLRRDSPRMALHAGIHALALCALFLLIGCGPDDPPSAASNEPALMAQDPQAPDTSIVRGPQATTSSRTADFEYASTAEGATFECSLDGGAWEPCEDSYTVGGGDHVLLVRAVDGGGNADGTPAGYTWTVVNARAFAGGGCSAAPDASWLALLGLMGVPGLRRRQRRAV